MLTFFRNVRLGFRLLLKSPLFTLLATGALAVGVGANVTVFAFANTILLKPLSVPEPDHLIRAYGGATVATSMIEYSDYLEYRDRNLSLSSLAAFHGGGLRGVVVDGAPEPVAITPVTGNYFETLGIRAALGRVVSDRDDKRGAPDIAVLSHAFWTRRFAADPGVIGRLVTVNGAPTIIVGITPESFEGTVAPVIPQIYMPWSGRWIGAGGAPKFGHLVGRLRPGVSLVEAQADLSRIAAQLTIENGRQTSILVYPALALFPGLATVAASFVALLFIIVGLVLLIACDNVAILLLARFVARRREIGIRLALGASRGQLVRQLLTENLLLSAFAGVVAVGFAYVAARALSQIYLPTPMPIALTFSFDWRVLLFTLAVSLGVTLLFGLGPVVHSLKTDVLTSLKQGEFAGGASGKRIRSGLVGIQVAMSTVLLVTSAVLVRSLTSPEAWDRGFSTDGVMMATVNLRAAGYTEKDGATFYARALERLEATPGILSANVVETVPLASPAASVELRMEARGIPLRGPVGMERVPANRVSRGHFRTLEIPLLEGRDFDQRDGPGSPAVAIVNEAFVRRFWPGESPIGQQLQTADGHWAEVVGLARDSKSESLREAPTPFLYFPISQQYVPVGTLLIKSVGNPASSVAMVRERIAELDPNLVLYNLNPMEDRVKLTLLPNRAAALASGILGILALALGAVGTYGTMSLMANQRRREMGVRMALGAPPASILLLIIRQGMTWTLLGLGFGLAGSLAATTLLRSMSILFAVPLFDLPAFAGTALVLTATALLACFLPARRAGCLDPLATLREE